MLRLPTDKEISKRIEPNYSTWQTIELTYQCAKYAIDNNIKGEFVECGVACGNNLAAMCLAGRHGYGFDSFEGIPWAGLKDSEQPGIGDISKINQSKIGVLESSGVTVHDISGVHLNFDRWGLNNYTLYKGWFQNTVHYFDRPISVLRLDGDLYDSTKVCLDALYPLLSNGGILIMDDWNLEGCRMAFDDYFQGKRPKQILNDGVTYWMK